MTTHTANTSTRAAVDDWRQQAACRYKDPDLFFSSAAEGSKPYLADVEAAKAVCRRCPVTADCLLWALDKRCDDGVWGGTTQEDRRAWRRPATPDPLTLTERVVHLIEHGYTDLEAGKRLGVSRETVRKLRIDAGVPANRQRKAAA